jgi:hypothetical protein
VSDERTSGVRRQERRQTDALLVAVEQSMLDRLAALAARVTAMEHDLLILDRDGSRGHAVLVQRVTGFEEKVTALARVADETHDRIEAAVRAVEMRLDRIDQAVVKANLDKLPQRVDNLEDAQSGRTGARDSLLRLVGPYAGFVFGLAAVIFALIQASGH